MEGNIEGVLLVNLLDFVTNEYICTVERGLGVQKFRTATVVVRFRKFDKYN